MKKKVCILTLGCPKNITDTEYVISSLPKDNFIFVQDIMKANIILLNTCGFISASIDESYNYIKVLSELKQKKTTLQIIVFGCLVSRFGVNKLKKKFPLVDAFYPILSSSEVLNHFNTKLDYIRQTLITPFHYSYLKISDGCNRGCAFCTIPLIKGKYKSVSSAQLLKEAKSLVKKGVKELILIGQETTNYGQDNSNKYDFVSLLDDISKIENVEWNKIDIEGKDFLTQQGGQIHPLSDAESAKWIKAVDAVIADYKKDLTSKGYKAADIDAWIAYVKERIEYWKGQEKARKIPTVYQY